MNTKNRQKFTRIMKNAWQLARYGAKEFGGKAADYFRIALVITWYDEKHPSVWQAGGLRFLLPGVHIKRVSQAKQLLLTGISL